MVRFLTLLALWLAVAPGAVADQNDPRLDTLFTRLNQADSAHGARIYQERIWDIWLKSGSDTVDLLVKGGIVAMGKRDYDRALELFTSVTEMAPEFAEGWNKRATIHFLMGDLERSLSDVEQTLVLEPRHFGALSGLGMIHLRLKDESRAYQAFKNALDLNRHLPMARREVERLRKKVEGEAI